MADVGRDRGVRYVLEGSVRKVGNQIRITAQLIDAATRFHLWSNRYDRELKDIFAVQNEITTEILTALQIKIEGAELTRADREPQRIRSLAARANSGTGIPARPARRGT